MGNGETLGRGSIQFMTAGTGITHQEHNLNKRNPLRFIQMWITPSASDLTPNYGSISGKDFKTARHNAWAHLVSDVRNPTPTPVKINQDANIHVCELDGGVALSWLLGPKRQAYLLRVEGRVEASGLKAREDLEQHDAAEMVGPGEVQLAAGEGGAHLLVVEMAGEGEDSRFTRKGKKGG